MNGRIIAGAAAGFSLALPLALACAGGVVTVSQIGKSFSVRSLHVQRGDTVRFTNDDRFDHQLLVDAPSFHFESTEQAPGTSKDILFTTPGTFDVQCEIHPRMHLAVTVD